jgi:flagellin
MAMTINTNVVSLNSQRNLGLSGGSLATSMQRLSSGLRVNSAKDDAAGLAIAERMNANTKGLAVASRNANDGISLAQTAEGALGKVGDMLQRMRELAVQSSNATNSASDREALQAEVSQLRSEIDRVAKTTSFNGQKLLDGAFSGAVFQVGANSGDNITVGALTKATAAGLGNVEFGSSQSATLDVAKMTDLDKSISGAKINVGGTDYALGEIKSASSGEERLGQIVSAINSKTADTGVTAFLEKGDKAGEYKISVKSDSDKAVTLSGLDSLNAAAGVVNVGTKDYSAEKKAFDDAVAASVTSVGTTVAEATEMKANVVKAAEALIKKMVGGDGATPAAGSPADTLNTALTAYKGTALPTADFVAGDVTAYATAQTTLTTAATAQLTASDTAQTAYKNAATTVNSLDADSAFDAVNAATTALRAAQGGAAAGMYQTQTANTVLTSTSTKADIEAQVKLLQETVDPLGLNVSKIEIKDHKGIDSLDIGTQAGAWEAIKQIDSAIDQVNAARGDLGALQTRFEKTVENIDIQNENITAARGRIVDADFATETANLSRAQILQQAGTAMVAQANQLPQNVLSLLR